MPGQQLASNHGGDDFVMKVMIPYDMTMRLPRLSVLIVVVVVVLE